MEYAGEVFTWVFYGPDGRTRYAGVGEDQFEAVVEKMARDYGTEFEVECENGVGEYDEEDCKTMKRIVQLYALADPSRNSNENERHAAMKKVKQLELKIHNKQERKTA